MKECSTCKAPVLWAVTAATGARIPLEPEPSPKGNLRLEERPGKSPLAHVVEPLLDAPGPRYRAHFVSCPDAARHRRTR